MDLDPRHNPVNVTDDTKAKLMYYLCCISSVLEIKEEPNLHRLTDFKNFESLTDDELDKLLIWCIVLGYGSLSNECIFDNEELCGNSDNRFLSVEDAKKHMTITRKILIGGEVRDVNKIMAYNSAWIKRNFSDPLLTPQSCSRVLELGRGPLKPYDAAMAYYYRYMHHPEPTFGKRGQRLTAIPSEHPYTEKGGVRAEPVAILVNYIACVSRAIDLSIVPTVDRLIDFGKLWYMTEAELEKLIYFCMAFNPTKYPDAFFISDQLCGTLTGNLFLSQEQAEPLLHQRCARTVLAFDEAVDVKQIMIFTRKWMQENFLDPINYFERHGNWITRLSRQGPSSPPDDQDLEYMTPNGWINLQGEKEHIKLHNTTIRDPKTFLMDYIKTIKQVVNLSNEPSFERLSPPLNDSDLDDLYECISSVNPICMANQCIFLREEIDGQSVPLQRVYSIEEARGLGLNVSERVPVAGMYREVKAVLVFTNAWYQTFYRQPFIKLWPERDGQNIIHVETVVPVVHQPEYRTNSVGGCPECSAKSGCGYVCGIFVVTIVILVIMYAIMV